MNGKDIIRLSKSSLSIHEQLEVIKTLDSEFLGYGSICKEFEDDLSRFLGTNAISVNSGTTSLILSLQVSGIKTNDVVITPSLTYLATVQAITCLGAIPYFCDVDSSGHLSIDDIPDNIIKKSKAIIFMHYAGVEIKMNKLIAWAKNNNLRVIEDAAHSFGSKQHALKLGYRDFDFVCYSFDGIKNITTAEGGCICAKNVSDQNRLKDIRLLGVIGDTKKRQSNKRTWEPNVIEQGWRAHMSNVNAAIGIAQLNRSDELWAKRKWIANYYFKNLKKYDNFLKIIIPNEEGIVPHIYPIVIFDENKLKKVFNSFKRNLIQYGRHYYPCHKLDFFKEFPRSSLKNTNYLYDHLISLPIHPDLTKNQQDFILKVLIENILDK